MPDMPETCRIPLVPFQTGAGEKFSCSVSMKIEGGLLLLDYAVNGPLMDIRVPQEAILPGFTLGLWQHTCCECFLRPDGGASYTEWNFSLDCNWWHCSFDAYRAPAKMQPSDLQPQNFQIFLRENTLALVAAVACPGTAGLRVGPAIIIEHATGERSHWAITHPGAKPDFHSPQSCVPLG